MLLVLTLLKMPHCVAFFCFELGEIRMSDLDEKARIVRNNYHNPNLKFYNGNMRISPGLDGAFLGVCYCSHVTVL